MDNKKKLLTFVEGRTGVKLDADKLLIGFSRLGRTLQAVELHLHRSQVHRAFLKSGRIQIVFSGKAHPLDDNGKQIVQTILEMTRRYPGSVVFLENYDMEMVACSPGVRMSGSTTRAGPRKPRALPG